MLSDSLAVYYLLQGVSVPEHSTEPPTKPFDGLRWADEKSLVWTVPAEGNMAEYIGLMFDEIGEALGAQTDAGLIVDLREASLPTPAGRSRIVAGVKHLNDRLCGVAIVVGKSKVHILLVNLTRFMMAGLGVPLRAFESIDKATAWLAKLRRR